MARSVLASELLSRLRQATDAENDTHVGDPELYRALTSAVSETWDYIQANGLGGEAVRIVYFNTVADQTDYDLTGTLYKPTPTGSSATIPEFYKVKTLYVDDGNGLYRPISRQGPNEHYGQKAPQGVYSMKLAYVPCAPVWTLGSESFDGINGWEEHVVQTAAIFIKAKKADDTGPYRARKREIEERMKTHANRNADEAPRIVRRKAAASWAAKTLPYTGSVGAWDIRGGNLELYSPSFGLYL